MVVELAHTAQLDPATLTLVRELLDDAFQGEFTDAEWDHSLGGLHALVRDGDEVVAHGAVVMRRLLHGGRALRTGYVEAVGVRTSARRSGHGAAIMGELGRVIGDAYDLGALASTDEGMGLYERLGWRRWDGPLFALAPSGRVRTPTADGAVFVLEAGVPLDPAGELTCDWRDGDVW